MSEDILATNERDGPRIVADANEIEDACAVSALPWQVAGEERGVQGVNECDYGIVRAGWPGGGG